MNNSESNNDTLLNVVKIVAMILMFLIIMIMGSLPLRWF